MEKMLLLRVQIEVSAGLLFKILAGAAVISGPAHGKKIVSLKNILRSFPRSMEYG